MKNLQAQLKALKLANLKREKLVAELINESFASAEYRDAFRIKWNLIKP